MPRPTLRRQAPKPAEITDAHRARIMPPAPTPELALTREGLALYAVGELRKAEQAFRAVAEVAPDHPLAWNNLALVLVGLEELEEAVAALTRSLALDPAQVTAWTSLAGVLARLGRRAEAADACASALALDSGCAEAWQVRAFLCAETEDFEAAAEAFSRTVELAAESAILRLNLGAALMRCGRFEEAGASLARAVALDPDLGAARDFSRVCDVILSAIAGAPDLAAEPPSDNIFKTALLLLNGAGERPAAARVALAWAAASPGNIEARHLCDAALARPVDRQPARLVAEHFDGIAEDFDDRLVRRLGYRGPEQLIGLIADRIADEGGLAVLDLGCGTGLCAPLLRPFAGRLAGVDLSPGMLAKARALGLYDSLEASDLLSALAAAPGAWDLLVAADTFPYLGDLEPVFAGAAAALRPGGWFAFSTEASDGEGFALQPNGRYVHGEGYVAGLAAGRFAIAARMSAPLRREAGGMVTGGFYLLRSLSRA